MPPWAPSQHWRHRGETSVSTAFTTALYLVLCSLSISNTPSNICHAEDNFEDLLKLAAFYEAGIKAIQAVIADARAGVGAATLEFVDWTRLPDPLGLLTFYQGFDEFGQKHKAVVQNIFKMSKITIIDKVLTFDEYINIDDVEALLNCLSKRAWLIEMNGKRMEEAAKAAA